MGMFGWHVQKKILPDFGIHRLMESCETFPQLTIKCSKNSHCYLHDQLFLALAYSEPSMKLWKHKHLHFGIESIFVVDIKWNRGAIYKDGKW